MATPIPKLRARLWLMAEKLAAGEYIPRETIATELRYIAAETFRNPVTRKPSPKRHSKLTDKQKLKLAIYAWQNPETSLQDIGQLFNTNSGRVSEALKWESDGSKANA